MHASPNYGDSGRGSGHNHRRRRLKKQKRRKYGESPSAHRSCAAAFASSLHDRPSASSADRVARRKTSSCGSGVSSRMARPEVPVELLVDASSYTVAAGGGGGGGDGNGALGLAKTTTAGTAADTAVGAQPPTNCTLLRTLRQCTGTYAASGASMRRGLSDSSRAGLEDRARSTSKRRFMDAVRAPTFPVNFARETLDRRPVGSEDAHGPGEQHKTPAAR